MNSEGGDGKQQEFQAGDKWQGLDKEGHSPDWQILTEGKCSGQGRVGKEGRGFSEW